METSDGLPESPLLLLDACCAINLLASGGADEILESLASNVAVARLVLEEEILRVGGTPAAEDAGAKATGGRDAEGTAEALGRSQEEGSGFTLQPLVSRGLIGVLDPTTEEEETYVNLALQLDDGEAATGALAIHREAVVATDDRKAIRILTGRTPPVETRRTSELVREWSEVRGVSERDVRRVLRYIEERASFVPPRDDPLREWWLRARTAGEDGDV